MRDAMPGRLSFDRVAAIYDETRGLAPRAMARVLAVLVDQLQGKRVLEVGVGTGRYAVPLQKSGIRGRGAPSLRVGIVRCRHHEPCAPPNSGLAGCTERNRARHAGVVLHGHRAFGPRRLDQTRIRHARQERRARLVSSRVPREGLAGTPETGLHHAGRAVPRDPPRGLSLGGTGSADVLVTMGRPRGDSPRCDGTPPSQMEGERVPALLPIEVTFWRSERLPEIAKAQRS